MVREAGKKIQRVMTSSAGKLKDNKRKLNIGSQFRWCSEGGQIYLCDFCPHAFCNRCLRWNLGR